MSEWDRVEQEQGKKERRGEEKEKDEKEVKVNG